MSTRSKGEDQADHTKLFSSVGLLVIGLIVLIDGLLGLPSNWPTTLLGAGISAFAGFEVRNFYVRVSLENKTIRATQSGRGNIQANQTNPVGSPIIQRADTVNIGGPQPSLQEDVTRQNKSVVSKQQGTSEMESICNGMIYFDDYQDFHFDVRRGDTVKIHVKSEDPVSIEIMNEDDFAMFEPDQEENDNYWESPLTTEYDYVWPSKDAEGIVVIIIDEVEEGTSDEEQAKAFVRIDHMRR